MSLPALEGIESLLGDHNDLTSPRINLPHHSPGAARERDHLET